MPNKLFNYFLTHKLRIAIIWLLGFCILLLPQLLHAQSKARIKQVLFAPGQWIKLDSLSIIPGSIKVYDGNSTQISDTAYVVQSWASIIKIKSAQVQPIRITYSVFPYNFNQGISNKDKRLLNGRENFNRYNPFAIVNQQESAGELFRFDGLNKSGSISRGISVGNRQDVIVNSSLNLQLNGQLDNGIGIKASITDETLPFQPDGYTQQLQEFDRVFVQFDKSGNQLTLGDFDIRSNPNSYFSRYYKRTQGIALSGIDTSEYGILNYQTSASLAKGRIARNTIFGQEGNQGPYRLQGNNNESFIIILAGTERVYINGRLLTRGQNLDYVIDYNTAEITFTPNIQITKDARLVVEFEYSDKNYTRTILQGFANIARAKTNWYVGYYNEGDLKNQPILANLTDSVKAIIGNLGDTIAKASIVNAERIGFSTTEIRYKRIDTALSLVPIYVYSTNKDSAVYRVGFSQVGPNKGSYVLSTSNGNGRVFKWVAPINGIPQGSYEPISLIPTPKKQQMIQLGNVYTPNKSTKIRTELALSNYDINLYSAFDKGNDKAFGSKIEARKDFISKKDSNLVYFVNFRHELVGKNFKPLDQFRNVEFQRDWNLNGLSTPTVVGNENWTEGLVGFRKSNQFAANIGLQSFNRQESYSGLRGIWDLSLKPRQYVIEFTGSFLNSKSFEIYQSEFIRQLASVSRNGKKWNYGLRYNLENNQTRLVKSDSLINGSFSFYQTSAFVVNADTSIHKIRFDSYHRLDYEKQRENVLSRFSEAFYAGIQTERRLLGGGRIGFNLSYRELDLFNNLPKEKTLLGKADFNKSYFKNALNLNTYYQIGGGQEMRREYAFQSVARGRGNYIWRDYNKNGIAEKNEFEVAQFADTANFIKVLVPTNEYVKAYTKDLSQSINLNPGNLFSLESKYNKLFSRFANNFNFQLSSKVLKSSNINELQFINPFKQKFADSVLVNQQSNYRNTLQLNPSQLKWGFDWIYSQSNNRGLFTNGIENKQNQENTYIGRVLIIRSINSSLQYKLGNKSNSGGSLTGRNYQIANKEIEPKLSYQPNPQWRLTASYRVANKTDNTTEDLKMKLERLSLESRLSSLDIGSFQANIAYTKINFNGNINSAVGYEMSEGLNTGDNYSLSISFQKNINSFSQLNLNYEGHKSPNAPVSHTGSVQIRAFF